MPTSWPARVVTWILALAAGVVFGVAGTISHPLMLGWAPVGMVVAAVGCLGLVLAIRLLIEDRGAVLACGLGMLGALVVFSGRGPGGSVVVPQAAEGEFPFGITWSIVLTAIVLIVAAWPRIRTGNAPKH
ncbi:histidinol dehydrogenase [Microbacterium karelineae]|uniref:histidinol dehydrogenase n=1 Tax=Microbacterium karelineae TaxID=2654283 RepID=UPI0012EA11A1|nr:histidinol dehydrogenase [Microbacterium karelineae]